MTSLHQDEIKKIEDQELKFRYLLGGIISCGKFWGCDIRCSCTPVPEDERFSKIKDFIKKHNISNSTFMKLLLTRLRGRFVTYNGAYGELISELNSVLVGYDFKYSNVDQIPENDLKEKELMEFLIKNVQLENSPLNKFLKKYNLTLLDFIVLAKTSLNYQYYAIISLGKKDLMVDLVNILKENNMYESLEYVKEYRDKFDKKQEKDNSKSLIKKLKIY